MDVEMPVMNGVECCRALKTNPLTRMIPVIMITSLSGLDDRIQSIDSERGPTT